MSAEAVVETVGLRKAFRRRRGARTALDGMDLVVPAGGVHGFLGPNGSGKTTTLRCLLGLVHADDGQMRLFGRPVPAELPAVVADVGALVETPAFFGSFSGRRNLDLLAGVAGVAAPRVEEVLEIVELTDRAGDRVRGYSLGMKQRLGIAAALLKAPRLLVLDEPTNGLDPAGIREVRELLRRLTTGGTTVLLSSHLLAEVSQVCDSVSIVSHGRLVADGAVADVLTGGAIGDVRVVVEDMAAAHRLLVEAGLSVTANPDHMLVRAVDDPARLSELLATHRIYVRELTPVAADLESVFLRLTGTG
ncbi:MAG: ABC transporter ATP-binding protein [Mycobacteriales bacterium]